LGLQKDRGQKKSGDVCKVQKLQYFGWFKKKIGERMGKCAKPGGCTRDPAPQEKKGWPAPNKKLMGKQDSLPLLTELHAANARTGGGVEMGLLKQG